MGCCKLGKKKFKLEIDGKHIDRTDKRFQIAKLRQLLKAIDEEIKLLRRKDWSNEEKTKRALYLSTMKIIFSWGEKMIEVNPEDSNLNELIDKAPELIHDTDEFKVIIIYSSYILGRTK